MEKKTYQTRNGDGTGVPRFFSIAELMVRTGLSRSSINRQIKAGNIPIVRIGNRILIPYSYLETLQTAAEAAATLKEDKEE
jgi:excisionase family DNA binding protein